MRILVTNDDGIHAEGLAVLERIARQLSDDVWVVAPETDQSGVAHSLSLSNPLRLRQIEVDIEEEIERRAEKGDSFAICYIDLDNFKPFADTFGFSVADMVIRDMGQAIRGAISCSPASIGARTSQRT